MLVAPDEARSIIERHGRNGTAWQILNPGISRRRSAVADGLVGYVRTNRIAVAAGDPVSSKADLVTVAEEFAALPEHRRVCWFCASAEFVDRITTLKDYHATLIGSQPVWHPASWQEQIGSHASLRAQLRRAENKGVVVTEWSAERAGSDRRLARVLDDWLASRRFPPLHFLVEPATLGALEGRRIFVAEQIGARSTGRQNSDASIRSRVVGFVILSPIPQRNGWLVEQFVRQPAAIEKIARTASRAASYYAPSVSREGAPNGTIELTVSCAINTVAAEGYDYVTLGLAPLSQHNGVPGQGDRFLRFLFAWTRLHGRRFYNFDGLDHFKTKFRPEQWEPIYAVANEPRISIGTLHAVGAAFSSGSPLLRLTQGITRAVTAEARSLLRSRRHL